MRRILGLILVFFTFFIACDKKESELFVKLPASQTGVHFINQLKDSPELNILTYLYYYNGAGIAAADFNNDDLIDLYFTANQGPDKLFLNQGSLSFRDVTEISGIRNSGNWTTGVTHVDINHDGLMDLYVCKLGSYLGVQGKNLLYVNQGNNQDGIPVFEEKAAQYGLDFSGFATQATFFDYDLDGDLDMFLLNHSVYPNKNYGKGSQREQADSLSGDRLYRNDNKQFTDVSAMAGIYQGRIGYGLGLGVSDLNSDGFPDIYVGNDFFENDYLYINQQDGTFKDLISNNPRQLGHTSHYSMGNDLADINNDLKTDIISLDMLPEDLHTYKTSALEYPYPNYAYYLNNGYSPQFMQNTLHLNLGLENFSEIAHLAGISATEWSWSGLIADFDNDSYKDIYITNGIKGATNDLDFINFIADEHIQKRLATGMSAEDMAFIEKMPVKKVPNYFFKNTGQLSFDDVTSLWYQSEDSFSNGSIYADLDNDGDLDLVVNNIDDEAFILENQGNSEHHYIQLEFEGPPQNPRGIGAKVIVYSGGATLYQENFTTRGYLSAVPPMVHVGLGKQKRIDSLQVIWPDGKYQTISSPVSDQKLKVHEKDAAGNFYSRGPLSYSSYLQNAEVELEYSHRDPETLDFHREPLVPFAHTNEGPDLSVADVNADGLEDLLISGAKGQPSSLFLQTEEGGFKPVQEILFDSDALSEDVAHVFFDADGDADMDLLIASGGNEFLSGIRLQPRLYLNNQGIFQKDTLQFTGVELNASDVSTADFDGDGDLDLCISSDQQPTRFGQKGLQYLFENNGTGQFTDVTDTTSPEFRNRGNIKDVVWSDLDGNGYQDLIAVGHWMPITVFMNDGEKLQKQVNNGLEFTEGWWNTIEVGDIDQDGDLDLLCGNWGMNSKLTASKNKPITLYNFDFDDNGTEDPVITHIHGDKETPFASKDELVKQMPFLNKKFLSYNAFAEAGLDDLFTSEKLEQATRKFVYELRSMIMENKGDGSFERRALPTIAQSTPIRDMVLEDFNGDGAPDILLVGNMHEISTQLGRMDASHGVILQNDKNKGFFWLQEQDFDIQGPARSVQKIRLGGEPYFLIAINNHKPVFLKRNQNQKDAN